MRVEFNEYGLSMLRKSTEAFLEATEQGCVRVMEGAIQLQAIDALWVCNSYVTFQDQCFESFRASPQSFVICLKTLHEKLKGSKCVLTTKNNQLLMNKHNISTPADSTPYDCVGNVVNYQQWPNFSVSTSEFNNVILDMCVGAGSLFFTIHANSQVDMCSEFDTGKILFEFMEQGGHFQVNKTPEQPVTSARLILKFFKIVCSFAILANFVQVFVNESVVLNIHDEAVDFLFVLNPYRGPCNHVIDAKNYMSSLRLNF